MAICGRCKGWLRRGCCSSPRSSALRAIEKLLSVNCHSADLFGTYAWWSHVSIRILPKTAWYTPCIFYGSFPFGVAQRLRNRPAQNLSHQTLPRVAFRRRVAPKTLYKYLINNGEPCWVRTSDLLIKRSHAHYINQLVMR